MSIFSGLEQIVQCDYPLADETWYGLGGKAEFFIQPVNFEHLSEIITRCRENSVKMHVLGFGSNLLIRDEGVRGAVVKLSGEQFRKHEFQGNQLTVGAGVVLNSLVMESVKLGLTGLEALTGIPGSIGGAVRMNAGGSFGDIGAVIESAICMDENGKVFEKKKPELAFDYRCCNITAPFILGAKISLGESDPDQVMRTVKEIWIYKKNSQPMGTKNAGCIFKNPRGMSAGALIDRAGMKGERVGGAVVSDKHANFFLAEEGCRSGDVLELIEKVRGRVREHSGMELELEIEVW